MPGGQPLFDLIRKPVEVRVAIDVKAWQDLNQVQNIGDQGTVEARLRLVQPVDHVGDHLAQPLPEVFRSAHQRFADVGVDLARNPRLLLSRHLNAEVSARRDGQNLKLDPEFFPQLFHSRVIFLPEEPVQLRLNLLDVLGIDAEKALDALFKSGLELAHARHEIEVEVRWQEPESLVRPGQGDLVEVLPDLPGQPRIRGRH